MKASFIQALCSVTLAVILLVPMSPVSYANEPLPAEETTSIEEQATPEQSSESNLGETVPTVSAVVYTTPAVNAEVETIPAEDVDVLIKAPLQPFVPTGLSSFIGDGTITVIWDSISAPNLLGYNVFLNGAQHNTATVTGTTYQINGLENGSEYIVQVKAVYSSEFSEGLLVIPMITDLTPTAEVTGFAGSAGNKEILLSWVNPTDVDFHHVEIYRNGEMIGNSTINTFVDNTIVSSAVYTYSAVAVDQSGNKTTGVTINVEAIDFEAPAIVTGLTAVGGPSAIIAHWTEVPANDLAGYNVYIDSQKMNDTLINETTYNVINLNFGQSYQLQVTAVDQAGNESDPSLAAAATPSHYLIELDRWGIKNDGTMPIETTNGLNEAIKWAQSQEINALYTPPGQYLISKDSYINLAANMLWEAPMDAVFQKETNGKENYKIIAAEYGDDNVTIKGGWYRGDRETHDYSGKDHPYSAGTHEGGHGVTVESVKNPIIIGVKSTHNTGDGLMIGGTGEMGSDVYAGHFLSGSIDSSGKIIADSTKIYTKNMFSLSKPRFLKEKNFEFSNWHGIKNYSFEVVFYDADGSFNSKVTKLVRETIQIPDGATQMRFVINQASSANVYGEYWQRVQTSNAVVKDSDFGFNRRQGITVGGSHGAIIENNVIHDQKGIAPQSGIDVEGGYGENGYLNTDTTIRNNEFFGNAAYDVILYDGWDAIVEGNRLGSRGAIGLAVSTSFKKGAIVKNNHFDGSRIFLTHDVQLLDNKMNDSYTNIEGPNVVIDGLEITNGRLSIASNKDNGVKVSNVTIQITDKTKDNGLTLWGAGATHFENISIIGESSLRAVTGGSKANNTFKNLKVIGYNSFYGLNLPAGTYTDSEFIAAEGGRLGTVGPGTDGVYVFENAKFVTAKTGGGVFSFEKAAGELTVRNSSFTALGDSHALSIQKAKKVVIDHNTIEAMSLTRAMEIIRINDYWQRSNPYDVLEAVINGNTISTNRADALAIVTIYAGTGAPAYTVTNNTVNTGKLSLKSNDIVSGNVVQP